MGGNTSGDSEGESGPVRGQPDQGRHPTRTLSCTICFLKINCISELCQDTAKLRGGCRDFPYTPSPLQHPYLPAINSPT